MISGRTTRVSLTRTQQNRMFELDMRILAKRRASTQPLMEQRVRTTMHRKQMVAKENLKKGRRPTMTSMQLQRLQTGMMGEVTM